MALNKWHFIRFLIVLFSVFIILTGCKTIDNELRISNAMSELDSLAPEIWDDIRKASLGSDRSDLTTDIGILWLIPKESFRFKVFLSSNRINDAPGCLQAINNAVAIGYGGEFSLNIGIKKNDDSNKEFNKNGRYSLVIYYIFGRDYDDIGNRNFKYQIMYLNNLKFINGFADISGLELMELTNNQLNN